MNIRPISTISRVALAALALLLVVGGPLEAKSKFKKRQQRPIKMGTSGGNSDDFNTGFVITKKSWLKLEIQLKRILFYL